MRARSIQMTPCERKIALGGQLQAIQHCQYYVLFQCAEDMCCTYLEISSAKEFDTVMSIQKHSRGRQWTLMLITVLEDAPSENRAWAMFLTSGCCDTELETLQHIGVVLW